MCMIICVSQIISCIMYINKMFKFEENMEHSSKILITVTVCYIY